MIKYKRKIGKIRKWVILDNSLLDQIANSVILGEKEKLSFLRHISFLTGKEQKELKALI